jgi:threonine dehydratase
MVNTNYSENETLSPENRDIINIIEAYKLMQDLQIETPLREYPKASDYFNAKILIKNENYNLGGSFKVRNALYYIWKHIDEIKNKKGVITATRGNFGIGISVAASKYNITPYIVVPKNNVPEKNELLRSYGAFLIEYGLDYDEAKDYAKKLSEKENLHFIGTADHFDIIYGAATVALSIYLQYAKPIDLIFVPIGSGSLVAGSLLVKEALQKSTQIIGVQPESANATYLSWKSGKLINIKSCETIADGLATRSSFALPFEIIKKFINDIILVSEDEIKKALKLAFKLTGDIIEPASATVFAALEKYKDKIKNKNVVLIITGKNISLKLIKECII